MTDEEQQNLCANLRADAVVLTPTFARHNRDAADEIERLAQRLAELEQRDRNIANDIRALARWI